MARVRARRRGRHVTRIDWRAAFAHYCELPPTERTIHAVATHFKISDAAVRTRADREDWTQRALALDRRKADKLAEAGVRPYVQRMRDIVRISEAARSAYAQALTAKDVIPSASDVVQLAKLEMLLEGAPTERTEANVQVQAAVAHLSAPVQERLLAQALSGEVIRDEDIIEATLDAGQG